MRTIGALRAGERAIVAQVDGGHGIIQRLAAMGILPGTELTVVRGGGPVIVEVRGNRLVLGRGMMHRVLVEAAETQSP